MVVVVDVKVVGVVVPEAKVVDVEDVTPELSVVVVVV